MTYGDIPLTIPLLASGYLLTIYLLLMLAERAAKATRYAERAAKTTRYVTNELAEVRREQAISANSPNFPIALRDKSTPVGAGKVARKASTSA